MTREEAKREILFAKREVMADSWIDKAFDMAIKALEQPEQRWIPCSEETGEGFPKEDGRYYVTEQNYGFYLDADHKEKVAHVSIFKSGDFTTRFYDENNSNITAWFKLPEPYEGEKE